MAMSRTEVNMRRLMAKCELILKDKNSKADNRLEKYITSLEEMLIELEKVNPKPSYELMLEYRNRLQKLKQTVNPGQSSNFITDKKNLRQPKYKDIRQELLGTSNDMNSLANSTTNETEVEMLLGYHNNMQEKIADEMLILTRNLKEQTILAGNIIRKDTETVKKSAGLAEENFSKLKVESEKLTDHSKRAWKCWMWLMIFIVMAVFINMVLFMKVMKKKNY